MGILVRDDALEAALGALVGDAHLGAGIERPLVNQIVEYLEHQNGRGWVNQDFNIKQSRANKKQKMP
jgi:hypothetical protein